MSRKNAKLAKITDLQCHQPTIILTKKDCDMIAEALWISHKDNPKEILSLYWYFKDLSKIRKGSGVSRKLRF
jgi:hypothetical protein